jgi:hypothetical protein
MRHASAVRQRRRGLHRLGYSGEHSPLCGVSAAQPTLTSFIGRERELAEAREHLRHSRLLTLTGVGGGGKTRLALELASQFVDDYQTASGWSTWRP